MSIAELLLALLFASTAHAHPVSQGAMEISVSPSRVLVRAFVSDEEVVVESAYGGKQGLTRLQGIQAHGPYLLKHLRVFADGAPLAGKVTKVPASGTGKLTYELE